MCSSDLRLARLVVGVRRPRPVRSRSLFRVPSKRFARMPFPRTFSMLCGKADFAVVVLACLAAQLCGLICGCRRRSVREREYMQKHRQTFAFYAKALCSSFLASSLLVPAALCLVDKAVGLVSIAFAIQDRVELVDLCAVFLRGALDVVTLNIAVH